MYLQHDPTTLKKVTAGRVLATYWKVLKKNTGIFYISLGSIVIAAITDVIAPIYYKHFFDTITTNGAPKMIVAGNLLTIILVILLTHAIGWIGWRLATFTSSRYQAHTMARLKNFAFEYLIKHSHTFFINNFVGSLVQRVNRFARAFETIADNLSWNMLPLTVQIVGISIVLFRQKPTFAIIIWCLGFVFISFNIIFANWKMKYDIKRSEADSKTSGTLADAFTNHTSINLFASFNRENVHVADVTGAQAKITLFTWNLGNIVEAVQAGFIITTEFFIFYFAIRAWMAGTITVGTFVLLQAYVISLSGSLWNFGKVVRSLYEAFADGREMVEILDTPHEIKDLPTVRLLIVEKGEVRFENVTFNYRETRNVLTDINFTVEAGEKVALIGPSGAGKSTVVRLILRLHDLSSGKILIDGQDIKYATQDSLHDTIALVPQEPVLFHRTIRENIRYGKPDASDEEVEVAARQSHSDEFIQNLPQGYDTYVGERGIKLSGGERQRIAIARAILKNAPILILDEATSSLDSHSESLIQDALEKLMERKTVIVIAHRLSTIRKMDRIIVLENGRIIEEGTHDGLLKTKNSLYQKLWKLQAGGFTETEVETI